jgi:hypothetical protein
MQRFRVIASQQNERNSRKEWKLRDLLYVYEFTGRDRFGAIGFTGAFPLGCVTEARLNRVLFEVASFVLASGKKPIE